LRNVIGLLLLAILSHLPNLAIAKERSIAQEFQQLFEFSGVAAHLSNVNTNVQLETEPLLMQCAENKDKSDVFKVLDSELSSEELHSLYVQELSERLSVDELAQIMNWIGSPAAVSIAEIDRLSGDLTEAQFNALKQRFESSPDNSKQRIGLISEVIKHTGAVYFLSAINTEISALVETAALCSMDETALEQLQGRLAEIRVDEGFYRAMMRPDVIRTLAVIYQDLSNEDLQALIDFAVSDAGKSYHGALIQGVRYLLQQKNNRIQQLLFTFDQSR